MRLNKDNWKPFFIKDIFFIENGKGITQEEIEENPGTLAAVQSGEENNGILGWIDINYCISKEYTYTVSPCLAVARSGSAGYVSFHPSGCVVGDSAKILFVKNAPVSNYAYLFLQSILSANRFKYSYGRKVTTEKYSNEVIKLPTTSDNTPDWQFMEDYIKSLHYKPIKTQNERNDFPFSANVWKVFSIKDLFDIELSKGDLKADECTDGSSRLISSGETNNGVVKRINNDGDNKADIFPPGTITVDMFCNAYYQEEEYYTVSHGRVNVLKPKFTINKYIGLFIVTLINKERYRFSYGRAVYSSVIAEVSINLPVLENGCPDWQYMEDYIKGLPFGDRI